jgi:hypothetical protein
MWDAGDITIPDFQRNFVWSVSQSSLLIESFLLGLPVPQVFFHIDNENKCVVIDGQQRLLSIIFYFDGYFGSENIHGKKQVFRLQGLDESNPYYRKSFAELSEEDQRKLKNAVLRAINIRQLNPKGAATCIYHIFERLNTGGTPLKPQEIRNCVFRGGFVSILRDLNQDANWRRILGKKTYDKHQKDVELILRIFSLSYGKWREYEKPMKVFLSTTMDRERGGNSTTVTTFVRDFPSAAAEIVKHLGVRPFHIRGPLNSSALDSVFCTILENIRSLPQDLGQRYKHLLSDDEFRGATYYGTSDASVLRRRFVKADSHLVGG